MITCALGGTLKVKSDHVVAMSGATGYVGKNLKKYFEDREWKVLPLARGSTTSAMIDLFKTQQPKIVFHLASAFVAEHATKDIENLILSNVLFGTQIAESMRVSGVRNLINTGSAWQHFQNTSRNPVSLYSATKNAFEDILQFFVSAENFRVINLEIFDTYGPGDSRRKLIPKLLEKGMKFEMTTGEQLLHLVHIDDICRAFEVATQEMFNAESLAGGWMRSYSLPSKSALSLRDIVASVEKIRNEKLDVSWGKRAYRKREVMQPWSPHPQLPNWRAEISLDDGLMRIQSLIMEK